MKGNDFSAEAMNNGMALPEFTFGNTIHAAEDISNMMNSWVGYASLFLFFSAYILIILEELLHLKKAKPIILVSCFIWMIIGTYESLNGGGHAHTFVEHLVAEIGGLFFFLLVAMTYINALSSLNVFQSLRAWLLSKGMSYRQLFWVTGGIAFMLSPFADNMTTALLMATVVYTIGGGNKKFIVPAFVNIVVAANAGGAWSPFGDITTLMVWMEGKVETLTFLYLVLPSIVNWIVPAFIMSFFVSKEKPECRKEINALKPGAKMAMVFGGITIALGVSFHQFLDLPPFMGMMLGMGFLMFVSYYMKRWGNKKYLNQLGLKEDRRTENREKFDFFKQVEKVEFDTLLFFFGVLTAVGALQYIGYLNGVGNLLYDSLGVTAANTAIGVISAVGDNIPLMYAVLKMNKHMGADQWLLVTLTTGVGGSMLSIGSAAGVAVMGINRENYTFMSHLKWAPVIIIGYVASIFTWWLVTSCAGLR